jgi:hypothetical protein
MRVGVVLMTDQSDIKMLVGVGVVGTRRAMVEARVVEAGMGTRVMEAGMGTRAVGARTEGNGERRRRKCNGESDPSGKAGTLRLVRASLKLSGSYELLRA